MKVIFKKAYVYKSNSWEEGQIVDLVPDLAKKMEEEGVGKILNKTTGKRGISPEDYEREYQERLNELDTSEPIKNKKSTPSQTKKRIKRNKK